MKKKSVVSSKDKKDWDDFTKQMGDISPKAADLDKGKIRTNKQSIKKNQNHILFKNNKLEPIMKDFHKILYREFLSF